MGFWSKLGKGLLGAAGVIAAPFTGGASLATVIPAVAGAGSAVLGAMSDSAAANRGAATDVALTQDQQRLQGMRHNEDAVMGRADLELRRRDDTRTGTNNAFRNAVRAAIGKNIQDVSFARPPGAEGRGMKGGLRPSALGEEGRAAMALMHDKAMRELMTDPQYSQLPEIERFSPSAMPKPGFMEKVLGPVGLGLGAVNTVAGALKKPPIAQLPNVPVQAGIPGGTLPGANVGVPKVPTIRNVYADDEVYG